ncbi:unnamed protein product [Anisakis simplex]|uniref:Rab-GAP TBC domain-containing protein n=1 Tax=Anisakis simplex TaxID=6269 RepID=A0A0M3JNQ0_ANISI|nr:unnamed protein product [Anisakis simplex]
MFLWYLTASKKIRDIRLKALFDSLGGVVESDAQFARFILPQLILQAVIEHNSPIIAEVCMELFAFLLRLRTDYLSIVGELGDWMVILMIAA